MPVLTADMPLHLEDHLDAATVVGSSPPREALQPFEWRFDEPQPEWKAIEPATPGAVPTELAWVGGALRLTATEGHDRASNGRYNPLIYVDLPDWRREDWADVIVRARTTGMTDMAVGLGTWEGGSAPPATRQTIRGGGSTPLVSDGSVQTYRLRPDWGSTGSSGPWRRLGLGFFSDEPGSVDILSVSVVPTAALYAGDPAAVRTVSVGEDLLRRTLVTYAPGSIIYRVRIPEAGRLDAALGFLRDDVPIEFRIMAGTPGGEPIALLRETYVDAAQWAERTVDLSRFAGQTITLALETDSEEPGAIAFWGAPTVSGVRATDKPNVIFYIIDGAGADYMSVYGYNRRTTPNLERIAAEGAVFERAYSNSSWTRPSTPSFLTSLQNSVVGGVGVPVPENVLTLAEHLHRAGYQTTELTFNPNAGRMTNLDRGHDLFRDVRPPVPADYSISSAYLQAEYWDWREAYPGEPYYVHFQTTDVHADHYPVPPFAGVFISPDRRRLLDAWDERLARAEASGLSGLERFEAAGVGWVDYWTAQRDLHDETMAHQDYQLGQLVARLKAQGEWERTLLIVAADHGVSAGASDYGILMRGPPPAGPTDPSWLAGGWDATMFASGVSRIPLIVVWAGRIAPGQRFSEPVSMIDVLPTILDLTELPMPVVMQGQSLAPLLLGEPGWEPRPVILDEFDSDGAGTFRGTRTRGERFWGRIEVIDGRWGASLQIPPPPDAPWTNFDPRSPPALLLYDLWTDPMSLNSRHEERPDLVEKYTKLLEEQLEAHLALGRHLTPSEAPPLTPAQLGALRSLGYIR